MPAELDDLIELTWYRYKTAYSDGTSIHNGLDLAGVNIANSEFEDAGTNLVWTADRALNFRERALSRYAVDSFYIIDALQWISDNWPSEPEPPEITMDDIINAMLGAEAGHIQYFVGLVDAYRQVMWNKPFNQEFFAAIARGFLE